MVYKFFIGQFTPVKFNMCTRDSLENVLAVFQMFINISSAAVHTAACILAFSSTTSTIGVPKAVLDVTSKEKIKRNNI